MNLLQVSREWNTNKPEHLYTLYATCLHSLYKLAISLERVEREASHPLLPRTGGRLLYSDNCLYTMYVYICVVYELYKDEYPKNNYLRNVSTGNINLTDI